mgnify:CR=1 FL=1|tara:strand:+ start:76 stop:537 length:462 start_codon:yes stop_codon:yes gene_type:complete
MIKVKYNIDFGKAVKLVEEKGLEKLINENVADKTARLATDYITSGKVKPKLSKRNPRGRKARPLFDTGKLAYSLKGSPAGISGADYAKDHRKVGGYSWKKPNGKTVKVPQREFIPHLKDGKPALHGTKAPILKIYEDFKKKFVRLLNKRMRKR